ncbi:MAG: UDP-Glc:alpha-D-GlcNAc-diphosphoundecaprenol beta-1,3-glucosyltransferase WfgD [uncultured marine phage]|uniref:UDP-Glc:alpha-D-GlcNAc-diphosphoundecaprenol beta-1,3-glucosyltransferase WfgD n=1 Tax=uncultured marine phage TaxID=707152 RepID=A0A8D9CDA7_9VIRU|nr:MAG: UDP-Glc:alpha-D-GlcNAc-diphosphoundecaprenol beta-1,3-glucosyltransferase WfgD [uncultured marine phage]
MKTPILGIVIPTKNESDNINTLLDSLLPQVPYNATVIISDNSDDDTIRKVISYRDDRIKIINGETPASARNKGAKELESDYILFLDANMELPKNLIRKSISSIRKNDLDLLTCKVGTKHKFRLIYFIKNLMMKLSRLSKPFVMDGYFLIRRETLELLGGFEDNFNCEGLSKKINPKKFKVLNKKVYKK